MRACDRALEDLYVAFHVENPVVSVMLTVGDPTDFRYFLPRILEIQRDSGVFGWPSIEVIFGHLRRADWQSWPSREVAALICFSHAVFEGLLNSEEHNGDAIDSWMCAFGRAGMDVQPFLKRLFEPQYRTKFIQYYEKNSSKLIRGRLSNAFWDNRVPMQEIVSWFQSEEVQNAIFEAYGL
ncbi:MAG: hypothetical protein U0Z75_05520 [Deinococcaceae bacterium]